MVECAVVAFIIRCRTDGCFASNANQQRRAFVVSEK